MQRAMAQREAVRLAKENLGDVPSAELAAYIAAAFGLTISPSIVTVLLGTSRERETLDQINRAVREKIEVWKAENPEEAKKLTASAKRKESARRRKVKASAAETERVPSVEGSAPPEAG